jgi:hypothetical protein
MFFFNVHTSVYVSRVEHTLTCVCLKNCANRVKAKWAQRQTGANECLRSVRGAGIHSGEETKLKVNNINSNRQK